MLTFFQYVRDKENDRLELTVSHSFANVSGLTEVNSLSQFIYL